jgi:tRNA threonylcarbamoyladenosine modification (KEOPS) complex Cgi121 subunit
VARGFGINTVIRAAGRRQIADAFRTPRGSGVKFIHALAVPGNARVANVPVDYLEVKKQVMEFIRE